MKNRALVCLFLVGMLIAACIPAPSAPAEEVGPPTQPVIPATSVPFSAEPTPTTIPLPAPSGGDAPVPTVPIVSIPLPGVGSPFASPNSGTLNCRTGPDVIYSVTAIINPDQSVEIVGKNADASWWYVKHPSAPAKSCWISAAFATVSGNASVVPITAVDMSVAGYETPAPRIIEVGMYVEPDTIDAPGCVGPIQPIRVSAKITTNGPLKMKVHFEVEQVGNLTTNRLEFFRADIQDVTDSFTPPLNDGTYFILLDVEGLDMSHLRATAYYTINC
jgi:hypothetical protein